MKLLICFFVIVAAAPVARAQTVAPPPLKMGLWQTSSTATMTGFQLPPEVVARLQAQGRPVPSNQPRKSVSQSCMTPESWQKDFESLQKGKECPMTNLQQSSAGMSADFACKSNTPGNKASGHIDIMFVNSQRWTGKMRTEIITASQPAPIVMNAVFDSVYLGSDCRGIAPGASKDVR